MMYVQSQDRILNSMKEEDRKTWLMARTLTAVQEIINTEEASETIRSE